MAKDSVITTILKIMMLPSAALFLDAGKPKKSRSSRSDNEDRILEILSAHRAN